MLKGGNDQLGVISDFDFTLTRSVDHDGMPCFSSHNVLNQLLYALHPELEEEDLLQIRAVNTKYLAIEYDPRLTKEEKVPYMIEWWTKAHEKYISFGVRREDMEQFVVNAKIELRDGADALVRHLASSSIPLLLFSAGVGNVIEIFLRHQLGYIPDNIHIISNMLLFNEEGVVSACSEPLIHVFCKDASVIPKNAPFYDDIAHR
ncbi:Pyrimidine 5'-nucleotidase [Cooperia oncophora]